MLQKVDRRRRREGEGRETGWSDAAEGGQEEEEGVRGKGDRVE